MAFVPVSAFVDTLGNLTEAARLFLLGLKDAIAGTVTSVTATPPLVSSGGTTPDLSHANSGVVAATYGDSTHVAQVAINVKGHVESAANVAIAVPSALAIFTADPVAPVNDTAWLFRDGGTPQNLELHAHIGGTTYVVPLYTLP